MHALGARISFERVGSSFFNAIFQHTGSRGESSYDFPLPPFAVEMKILFAQCV